MIRHLPTVFKPVGAIIERQGVRLRVVKRPEGLKPSEACGGCFYGDVCTSRLACSSFDRKDGVSVWFQKVDDNTK